jgi:G3E family GTPase
MQALGIIGSYGSGKTTTLVSLAKSILDTGDTCGIIINDVLAGATDRSKVQSIQGGTFDFLAGGCIGCQDKWSFVDAIQRYSQQQVDFILYEQPGYEHPSETLQILKSLGIVTRTLILLDGKRPRETLSNSVFHHSLELADRIGITKTANHQETLNALRHLLEQLGYTGVALAIGSPQALPDNQLWQEIRSSFQEPEKMVISRDRTNTPMSAPLSIRLIPGKRVEMSAIEEFISIHGNRIERLKGTLFNGDELVEVSYSIWEVWLVQGLHPNIFPELIVYTRDYWVIQALEALNYHEIVSIKDLYTSLPGWSTIADRESEIQKLNELFPNQGTLSHTDEILVDFGEADLAYQLAKTAGINTDLKSETITRFLNARLDIFSRIEEAGKHAILDIKNHWKHREIGYKMARVWVVLGYHAAKWVEVGVPPMLLEKIKKLKAAELYFRGLSYMEISRFNENAAEENPDIARILFEYGVKYESAFNSGDALTAMQTFMNQAKLESREDWVLRWQSAIETAKQILSRKQMSTLFRQK